jgi:Zn-dependent M28 family amino/carboxypeptidase
VRLRVNAVSEMRRTRNVIAELGSGPEVAMAGAHLDSVPEGPGVNDDGSGVATLLELAEQLGPSNERPPRRVRLAFWGAEELGLYGSRRYVRGLSAGERKRIAGYLNLDMLGSGNGGRLIYGGTSSAPAGAAAAVRRLFRTRGVRVEVTHPGADSDHAPFEAAGIPILGLFSGASEIKRGRERAAWGGRAGRPYDSCYHLACDRLARMDMRTLSELSDGAAVAVFELAHP